MPEITFFIEEVTQAAAGLSETAGPRTDKDIFMWMEQDQSLRVCWYCDDDPVDIEASCGYRELGM